MAVSFFQSLLGILVAVIAVVLITVIFPKETNIKVEKSDRLIKEAIEKEGIEVKTRNGRIQGYKEFLERDSRDFYSFNGIPYAEPPVNNLRFKDPVAAKPWSGIKGGSKPPPCPQYGFESLLRGGETEVFGQEDCLYLNVHTPKLQHGANLPVMVFIHGGGFVIGDAESYGGTPRLLLSKDIVLVSIQYRLGTLGFLSTEDSVLPGNLGMKDQTLALRWVQENIKDFGGDHNKVTIFGQSAGGASVHLHLLSPYSEGLFQRAILHSGNALSPFAVRNDHKAIANEVRQMLKCPEGDSTSLLRCLRTAPLDEIVQSASRIAKFTAFPFYMIPRVDGDYLPEHPALLLKEGRFHKVNLMSGFTSHEGAATTMFTLNSETLRKKFVENFDTIGPVVCGVENEESAIQLTKTIFYHHMDDIDISEDYAEELTEILSESYFNRGHDDALLIHAKDSSSPGTKTFIYEFEHRGQQAYLTAFNVTYGSYWVSHSDELTYLFDNVRGLPPFDNPTDIFMSNIMVELWTNFALTGNPTPDLSLGFKWHSITEDAFHHLALRPSPAMRNDRRAKKREFWSRLPITINKLLYPEQFEVTTPSQ